MSDVSPPSVLVPTPTERIMAAVEKIEGRLSKIEAEQVKQTAEQAAYSAALLDSQPVRKRMAELALEAETWIATKRDYHRALLTWPTTRFGGLTLLLLAAALAAYEGLNVPELIRAWNGECPVVGT